eukprot:TRINITY_DN358_c0_g1_i1.p1 TRINITY_DN358_c0_g1~~TRINITY_DN358_c0_g1_i1.p1  ORF type:complete len:802 (+),score=194.20 TRINITY_DN358_c0_g1_i1:66-2471(+)
MRLLLLYAFIALGSCETESFDDEDYVASQLSCLDTNNDGVVQGDECPIAHELDDGHLDINGLKLAWLKNPARRWSTDEIIAWAKQQQLKDFVFALDQHNVQGNDIPKLAANDDLLYAQLGITKFIDRHRLSAKAYDLLIFGPNKRYSRYSIIVTTVLAIALAAALMVIKKMYWTIQKVKKKTSSSGIEDWLAQQGYEEYAELFHQIGAAALLDMTAEQLRGLGVAENDCLDLENDILSYRRVFVDTDNKARRRTRADVPSSVPATPRTSDASVTSPLPTRNLPSAHHDSALGSVVSESGRRLVARQSTLRDDGDNSVFPPTPGHTRHQSSLEITGSPMTGRVSHGSTFLLSPQQSSGQMADSGFPDSNPESSESSAPTTQSEADGAILLRDGVFGRYKNELVLLDVARLHQIRKVGSGQYGEVWKANWSGTTATGAVLPKRIVAAKILKAVGVAESDKHFQRELDTLSKLSHPNIIELLGASNLDGDVILVTSYANAGSLFQFLHAGSTQHLHYNYGFVYRIAKEIASGMQYLFSQHILHRDLKSQNVLLHDAYYDEGEEVTLSAANACRLQALIGDFGLSKHTDHLTMMTGTPGTPGWMAPEVIRNERSGSPADVYSYSIVVWEVLCRSLPWQGMESAQILFAVAAFHKRPPVPEDCPDGLQKLLTECWDKDPAKRPQFSQIVEALDQFDVECSVDDDHDDGLAATQMTWQGDINWKFNKIKEDYELTVERMRKSEDEKTQLLEESHNEIAALREQVARLERQTIQANRDRKRNKDKDKDKTRRRKLRRPKTMTDIDSEY